MYFFCSFSLRVTPSGCRLFTLEGFHSDLVFRSPSWTQRFSFPGTKHNLTHGTRCKSTTLGLGSHWNKPLAQNVYTNQSKSTSERPHPARGSDYTDHRNIPLYTCLCQRLPIAAHFYPHFVGVRSLAVPTCRWGPRPPPDLSRRGPWRFSSVGTTVELYPEGRGLDPPLRKVHTYSGSGATK